MNNNFWLEINGRSDFPDIGLPSKVELSDDNYSLLGYFSSFEDQFSKINLLEEVKKYGFKRITNSNSIFVLFFFDKRNQTLHVAVDQFLSFSCYFSIFDNRLVFSSSFGDIKNELRKTHSLKVDADFLLSYLLSEWSNTDRTLINQVRIVPGGAVATFNLKTLQLNDIHTLIDVDLFYSSIKPKKYKSLQEFSHDWLALLNDVVKRRVEQVPKGFKVGCDISSGFDCTLVSYCLSKNLPIGGFNGYSNYSKIMGDENSPDVVKCFCQRYNISLTPFDYTQQTLHLNNLDQDWPRDQAVNPFSYVHHQDYINFLNKDGIRILFTGEYGDESYDMKNMELFSRFPVQHGYFDTIIAIYRRRLKDYYTDDSIPVFRDQRRFQSRGYYPTIIPGKNAAAYLPHIEAYANRGVIRINPYSDTRLMALSSQVPLPTGVEPDKTKELLMPYFKYILPENYIAKSNAGEPFLQLFLNQKAFVLEVLSSSVLAKLGLLNTSAILKYINNPLDELYTDKTYQRAMRLYDKIYLDWYLQKNSIS